MPSAKFDADISSFKNGISSAKSEVRTLDQQMKMIDATFKATGNSEQALAQKTQTLNSRMTAQKAIADQAKQALDAMTQKGIDPASEAYQKMARELLAAQTGMMETQAALNDLSGGAIKAADSANQLEKGLNGISKKISLEQVISGIGKITDGLEKAAQKAVKLGEDLWNSIMDSAKWADDTSTMAQMYGIDLDTFQKMQNLVKSGLDTTVDAMLNAQTKLNKNVGEGADKFMGTMRELGLVMTRVGKFGSEEFLNPDSVQLFWDAGQAIMKMGDAYDKEAAAQTIFGKSWKELVPLFEKYKTLEEYNEALENQQTVSEESVTALAGLNDEVGKLKTNFDTLKNEVMGSLAPALTDASKALSGLLSEVLEYMKTPEGKKMLEDLGTAVSGLFDDLGKIDPEQVVSGFTTVFNTVVGSLQWLVENKDIVADSLIAIVGAWGAMKIGSGVLSIIKLIDGLRDLGILGGGTGAAAEGGLNGIVNGGGLLTAAGNKLANVLPGVTSWIGQNGGSVWDWFVHNTPIGQEQILGTREKGSWWNEIQQNWNTFIDDWKNTEIVKFWTRRDMNQDAGTRLPQGENWLPSYMQDIQPKIEIIPEAPKDAALDLADQVGTVNVPVNLVVANGVGVFGGDEKAGGGTAIGRGFNYIKGHANGLPYVPFDNYLAYLHKGERVMPAREVTSRNYTSNLYVERMEMHNGQDAEGLAARIATAQRRTMNGYGS